MSEYYDRPFSASQCVRRDMVITWHPYVAIRLVEAFQHCGPRKKKPSTDTLNNAVMQSIKIVWDLLQYRECIPVTEFVFDLIDEEDMRPSKLIARLLALHDTMSSDTLLTHDSVMCHRSPNVCYSFSHHELCAHEYQSHDGSVPTPRTCGGRHLCTHPHCTDRRKHSGPFCTMPNKDSMPHSQVDKVRKSIVYRNNQGRQNSRRGRGRGRGRGGRGRRGKGKNPNHN